MMTRRVLGQLGNGNSTAYKITIRSQIRRYLIVLSILLTMVVLLLSTPASAAEARYKNPKVGKYPLDYCKKWGKECGKPAADAYCRKKGYRRALKYRVKKDTPPTKVISSGQVCKAPGCDRINYVVCEAEAVFRNPKVGKYALDLCRQWGKGCGKPAADAFCRKRGFRRAVDFAVGQDRPPTRVIGTGQVCNQSYCDRIVLVTCKERKGGKSAGGSGKGGKADDFGDAMTVGGDAGSKDKGEGGDALSDSDYEDDYGLFED